MNTFNRPNFFGMLMLRMKRFAAVFREKPSVSLDDFVLEHFILYHGLVGTTPEDQPQFKDVRESILEAILKKSSVEMAIALKLPPLWWEEKLAAVIGEAHQYHEELEACLLPVVDENADVAPESIPLRHPDWRVRANAAKILADIKSDKAIPQIVAAMREAVDVVSLNASYCYLIYALSKFGGEEARAAVVDQLSVEEPWFKVDAVGALTKWKLDAVKSELATALKNTHELSDYAAVAVSKNHRPIELLALSGDDSEAGLEVVIGLTQAVEGPFVNDTTFGALLEETFPLVYEMAKRKSSPRRLRALLELCAFITAFGDSEELQQRAEEAKAEFTDSKFGASVMTWFEQGQSTADPEFRHALKLAAHYKLAAAAPFVQQHLRLASPLLNEAIEATATIGGEGAGDQLVTLVGQLVNLQDRTTKAPSKQPVFEEKPTEAKTYWLALRALGNLPSEQTAQLLLKAIRDFAPDKRQQAYLALVQVSQNPEIMSEHRHAIVSAILEGLSDVSPAVRIAALIGVEKLALTDLIPDAVRLTAAKENSIVRQARKTLAHLAQDGHAAQVTQALKSAINSERDTFRRQRLSVLLEDVSQC